MTEAAVGHEANNKTRDTAEDFFLSRGSGGRKTLMLSVIGHCNDQCECHAERHKELYLLDKLKNILLT